jgi:hypothetical protein
VDCFELKVVQSVEDKNPDTLPLACFTRMVVPEPITAPVPPVMVRTEEVTSVRFPVVKVACLLFIWVWIDDVASTNPRVVLVMDDAETKPEPSDNRTRLAVRAASLEYAIAALEAISAFTILAESDSFE